MAACIVDEKLSVDHPVVIDRKFKYIDKSFVKKPEYAYKAKKDFKIFVGSAAKASFLGHKAILQDAHELFGDSFSQEGGEGSEVYFNEITAYGFTPIFEYFYNGYIVIDPELFTELLEAASFFKNEWILEVCRHFMIHLYGDIKYSYTVELAERFGLDGVKEEMCRNFGTFLSKLAKGNTSFKDSNKDLLLDFLRGNFYTDALEFFILQYLIKWESILKEEREQSMLTFLSHIRFHIMTPENLKNIPEDILNRSDIRKKVEDAKLYWSNIPNQCLQDGVIYLSRGAKEVVIVSAFHDASERSESNILAYKDPSKDEQTLSVEELGPSGLKADYTTMNQASLGNFLFAAGGYDKTGTSLSCVYMFDARTKRWTEIASMSQARTSFAMCSSKNRLYVIGGVCKEAGDENILSSVEMYVPEENKWKSITSLESSCFNQAAICCNNTLYVTGGIVDVEPVSSVLCLQEGMSKWTMLQRMSACRQGHSMAENGGKIYVLGGYTAKPNSQGLVKDCDVNEVFDLRTKQWTTITRTPISNGHLYRHIAIVQNKIYFLCNIDSDVYLNSFDMKSNKFSTGALIGRGVHKVGVLRVAFSPTCLVTPLP